MIFNRKYLRAIADDRMLLRIGQIVKSNAYPARKYVIVSIIATAQMQPQVWITQADGKAHGYLEKVSEISEVWNVDTGCNFLFNQFVIMIKW